MDGYYDLDDYGDWQSDPDYGEVWIPRGVAVGWAPYHVGHWVYIAPWGWTWVDEEPWGFAPFHYGRWAYVGGSLGMGSRAGGRASGVCARACWLRRRRRLRLSVAFGGGFTGVAWFPLGPRDVFVPGYHCSPRYVQNVNVTNTRIVNVTQVTNVYNTVVVNRDVTHVNYTYGDNERAMTAVSRDTFVNARPVNQRGRAHQRGSDSRRTFSRFVSDPPTARVTCRRRLASRRPSRRIPSPAPGCRTAESRGRRLSAVHRNIRTTASRSIAAKYHVNKMATRGRSARDEQIRRRTTSSNRTMDSGRSRRLGIQ